MSLGLGSLFWYLLLSWRVGINLIFSKHCECTILVGEGEPFKQTIGLRVSLAVCVLCQIGVRYDKMKKHNTNGKLSKEELFGIAIEEIKMFSKELRIDQSDLYHKSYRDVKELAILSIIESDLYKNRGK